MHAEINEENARFQHEAKGSIPHNHRVNGGSKAQRNRHAPLRKTAAAEPIKSNAKSSREEHLARIRRKHAAAKVLPLCLPNLAPSVVTAHTTMYPST